jgi:hypothetical protein
VICVLAADKDVGLPRKETAEAVAGDDDVIERTVGAPFGIDFRAERSRQLHGEA